DHKTILNLRYHDNITFSETKTNYNNDTLTTRCGQIMNDKNYEIDELLKVKDLRKASVFVFFMSTEPRFEWVGKKYFSGDRNDKSRLRDLINEVIGMANSNYNDLTNKVLNNLNNNLISI
ncbi:hypothetical protein Q4R45_22905, partial [Morganella morganii subsp. sibonii]